MHTTETISTPDSWGATSSAYTKTSLASIPRIPAELAATLLLQASPPSASGIHFLDVAGGPGTLSTILASKLKEQGITSTVNILATDFSPQMVQGAETAVKALELPENFVVSYRVMDAQKLEVESETITHLGCLLGIMFFPDRPAALKEMHRVLKKGE